MRSAGWALVVAAFFCLGGVSHAAAVKPYGMDKALRFVLSINSAESKNLEKPSAAGDAVCTFNGRIAEVHNLQVAESDSDKQTFDLGNEMSVQLPCYYDGYAVAPGFFAVPMSATKASRIEIWVDAASGLDLKTTNFVPFHAEWQE